MTKMAYTLALTILLIPPSVCFSSFRIELTNGSEYITARYWEADSTIQFYYHGGIVSIPKDSIDTIAESDEAHYEEPTSGSIQPVPEEASTEPARNAVNGRNKALQREHVEAPDEEVDLGYYEETNSQLKVHLGSSLKLLREASRNRDQKGKERAKEEIEEYSRRIYELGDELRAKNKGVLPEDWWEGVDELP